MRFDFSWITDHWGMKVVSLILAIGFWFYALGEESIEVTRSIPLNITISNEKLSIVQPSVQNLRVTFQAPRHFISNFSFDAIKATHVINNVETAGEYTFTVTPSDILLPYPEIKVIRIFPQLVTVTLDEIIVKKLVVKPNLLGDPAYGYRVDEEGISIDPNAVLVEGPKAALEKMDSLLTEPIQLVGRVRPFRRNFRIESGTDLTIMGDPMTDVQIPIKPEFSEQELTEVSVRPLGTPAPERYVVLDSKQIGLVVKGPKAELSKVEGKSVLAYVDVEGLKEGDFELPVEFVLPPDISVKNETPKLLVHIRKS